VAVSRAPGPRGAREAGERTSDLAVLSRVPLGRSHRAPPPAPEIPELRLDTELLSREEVDTPEIRAAHAASSLADAAEAAAWRGAALEPDEPALAGPSTALRPHADADLPRESLDRVIRRRGSTRVFDCGRSIGFEELSTALDRATRGVPADAVGKSVMFLVALGHPDREALGLAS